MCNLCQIRAWFLWRHKNYLEVAMRRVKRMEENAWLKMNGETPKADCADKCRIQKKWSSRLSRWIASNSWTRPFLIKESYARYLVMMIFVLLLAHIFGLVVFTFVSLKMGENPKLVGAYTGAVTQLVAIAMIINSKARIIGFISVPGVFTGYSKSLIVLLMITWTLQGPCMNTTANVGIMMKGLACASGLQATSESKLNEVASHMNKFARSPLVAVDKIYQKFRAYFKAIYLNIRLFFTMVLDIFKQLYGALERLLGTCDQELLTPYEYCLKGVAIDNRKCDEGTSYANTKCFFLREKMQMLYCNSLKAVLKMCNIKDFLVKEMKRIMWGQWVERLRKMIDQFRVIFFFEVTFTGKFSHNVTQTNAQTSMLAALIRQYRDRMQTANRFLGYAMTVMDVLFYCYMVLPILKSVWYLKRFLKRDHKDNYIVTSELKEVNRRRDNKGQTTIYPLMPRDKRWLLLRRTEIRMNKKEFMMLLAALGWATVQMGMVCCACWADVGIHWTATELFKLARTQGLSLDALPHYELVIKGDGVVAESFRSMMANLKSAKHNVKNVQAKFQSCFEMPRQPDYGLYSDLITCGFVVYLLCFLHIYGRRFRSAICGYYYPKIRHKRAVFLYNKIVHSRAGIKTLFMKVMKKIVSIPGGETAMVWGTKGADIGLIGVEEKWGGQNVLGDKAIEGAQRMVEMEKENSPEEGFKAHFEALERAMPYMGQDTQHCTSCSHSGPMEDLDNFRPCSNEECLAPYCVSCFNMHRLCLMCGRRLYSLDFEEAKDSSFDDEVWEMSAEERKRRETEAAERREQMRLLEEVKAMQREGKRDYLFT